MKLKIAKQILEAALIFRAKNDVRYYLNRILFKSDGRVVSTNGHTAFVAKSHDNKIADDIIIDIGKSPTKTYSHAEIDTVEGIVRYIDSKSNCIGVGMAKVIDGKFPDIDRVINLEQKPCDSIGFNASYIVDIAKAAKIFNPKFEAVKLILSGENGAAKAVITSIEGYTAEVVVMPCRL